MRKLLFIYHDELFLDFAFNYFKAKGFSVFTVTNGLEGIKVAKKEKPDILIIDKKMKGIDLKGFLVKKGIDNYLKSVTIFLIGDFVSSELQNLKKYNIKAYISVPINPTTLLERLNLFFKIPLPEMKKTTPMLVDMHIKGKIIIIQIEANFEPDKLEILNYEIRTYCFQKKIKSPKILFIIPSLYPESITEENIELLFKFKRYEELKIDNNNIKILSQCTKFLEIIKKHDEYSDFEIVCNFIDGIQKLNLDIDNKKIISISHLKENASYIYNLYDNTGMVRIPALTKVTFNMIDYLLKSGEKKLTYYSETNLEEINNQEVISSETAKKNFDTIISNYELMDENIDIVKNLDDKKSLFFKKLEHNKILIISDNDSNNDVINGALKPYVNIDFFHSGSLITEDDLKEYILVFIDIEVTNPTALDLLKKIRDASSRRQISVIITATKIGRETLSKLKTYGTDNILLSPFNINKVLQKVFESVSSDRNS